MINAYEKIIKTMRQEGARNNPQTLEIGEVKKASPLEVKLGALELDKDDVLFCESLKNKSLSKGNLILMYRIEEKFILIDKVV